MSGRHLQLFRHRGLHGHCISSCRVPELELHAVQVVAAVTCIHSNIGQQHSLCNH
jgi:hypothetical protein